MSISSDSFLALKPLVLKCFKFAPFKVLGCLVLMLLASITSGVGILLIVPLLASIGVDIGVSSSSSGFAEKLNDVASFIGLELNLGSVLISYLCLIIALSSLSFVNTVMQTSLKQSFIVHFRIELSRKLFFTQWCYLNREHMSDFMRLLTGQVQSVGTSVQFLLKLASSIILVGVYLTFALLLSAKLTLVAFLCAVFLAAILWPINKRIHGSGKIGLDASRGIYRSLFENVSSLKIIKSFSAEEHYLQRMASISAEMEEQQVRMAKFNALTRLINMIGAAFIFTLLFYSAIEWLGLPVSNLLVVLFIFSRLMPQISLIQGTVQSLIHQAPMYQDLLSKSVELEKWSEQSDAQLIGAQPIKDQHDTLPPLKAQLHLENVSYQYIDNNKLVLNQISATIQRNETVAIVGPSGVGKSTLADLISGLIAPSLGQIKVDNTVIDDTNRLAWRKHVAYVTQDVFLFHDSVRNNLSWVCEGNTIDDNALWNALNLAAADEFVRKLPQGLDTLIGDRGVKLSGGERQRLSLARALLSNPDILILDEATSALDRQNELKIRDALIKLDGKLTIFIIAHNETTIEHVAQRIELT